ncbi:MAG: hypothetical protein HFG93_02445 [Dorea sp.]|jgi:hypothetical protein|nr:hypothetical protein [Dorea sp.]
MEQRICMYCGRPVEKTKYVLRAGKNGEYDICCCGTRCYQDMKRYIEHTSKKKYALYLAAAVLILMNLVILGLKLQFRLMYLPMTGLGAVFMICPSLYVTSWFFERYGVKKTTKGVRTAGALIILAGLWFTIL